MTKDEAKKSTWDASKFDEYSNAEWTFNAGFDVGVEYANRWYVIERDGLPTENTVYLMSTKQGGVTTAWFIPSLIEWVLQNGETLDGAVAWRPLPEPYKGE